MFKVSELIKATSGKLLCGDTDAAIQGISIDTRTIKPGQVFIAIKGLNFDGHDFIAEAVKKGAGCIIAQRRATSYELRVRAFIEVKDTTRALGEIAGFHRKRFKIPVIAVTGSNGKTTAKEMIARVLSGRGKVLKNIGTKNNHIGLPLTLLELNQKYELAVLEIGTNHFGEVDYLAGILRPNIGIITNIGPSHLEFFNTLKGIYREKCALLKYLEKPAIAVLNSDDALLKKDLSAKSKEQFMLGVGIKAKSDFCAGAIKTINGGIEFVVNRKYKFILKTPGRYNIYNALFAIALGRVFGMSYPEICARLADFKFPLGRLNLIELNKIRFIDDTYNSNPLSLESALDALDNFPVKGRKIMIMGDMLELGSKAAFFHRRAGYRIASVCDTLISVGKLSALAAEAARKAGFSRKKIFACENSAQARQILFEKISLSPDDIILVKGSRSMKMEEVFT